MNEICKVIPILFTSRITLSIHRLIILFSKIEFIDGSVIMFSGSIKYLHFNVECELRRLGRYILC